MLEITLLSLLTKPVEAFAIAILANISTRYIPKNKKNKEFKKEFGAAVKRGADNLLSYLSEGNQTLLQVRINKEQAEKLFGRIIERVYSQDDDIIKEFGAIIIGSGIDSSKIPDFSISKAHSLFCEGFKSWARYSPVLHDFLLVLQGESKIKPTYDFFLLKNKYFDYLKQEFSLLDFKGLNENELISIPLKDLYTTLEFSKDTQIEEVKEPGEIRNQGNTELSDVLDNKYSVITGDPGSGKTTLLQYIALCFVNRTYQDRLKVKKPYFPVFFPVAALSDAMDKNTTIDYQFETFLSDYFKSLDLQDDILPAVKEASALGEVIYLIDGLDEVSNESRRLAVIKKIQNYITNKDEFKNRFIVTCRTASYKDEGRFYPSNNHKFEQYNVNPFKEKQIRSFLLEFYRWYYREYKKKDSFEKDAQKKCSEMIDAIMSNEKILEIATNPLMLTIFALIEHTGGEMPKSRAELYFKCIRLLTENWERLRTDFEKEDPEFRLGGVTIDIEFVIKYLGKIAFELHSSADKFIERKDFIKRLAGQLKNIAQNNEEKAKQYAKDFIKILGEKSGIIEKISTDRYQFMHQTFREYLAARYLIDVKWIFDKLGKKIFEPEWLEVALLASASLSEREATKLLKEIYNCKYDVDIETKFLLVGRCIEDIGSTKIADDFYNEFYESLEKLAFTDSKPLTRVKMAEVIGRIGDRRDDYDQFIKFETKEYDLEDIDIDKIEIRAFEMGKYPVSNRWFEEFISFGGYHDGKYFSREGNKWLKAAGALLPGAWNQRKYNCPNSPVVGVSWYEADAFCRWLTQNRDDGHEYRLPSEFEWQAAAAGEEKRKYPWGKEINPDKCNYHETEIGRISPVGIFEEGKTLEKEGVYDLAGNVWEWTQTDYHNGKNHDDFIFDKKLQELLKKDSIDEYIKELENKKRELPVLRGGSFFYFSNICRCASRNDYLPNVRDFFIGFRCSRIKL